jgi:LysR family transcriptional regulator, glycine cleavage system transcriptional activator
MARQLPSLNALRAFEAAARHESFSKAADELHVTHAAVSHQVRALEEWFGARLFKRLPGRVELIGTGERYGGILTQLFDQLDAKTSELKSIIGQNQLSIKIDSQFAAIWLVPRIVRFSELYPEIELDVITEYGDLDPRKDEAPLAIQYIDADETLDLPDVTVECLLSVAAFPVCRPDVFERLPVNEPADILKHTLLHGEDRDWWRQWFTSAGVEPEDPLPGPQFSQSYLALLAAEGGQGIALLDDIEAADALADGRLVRVLNHEIPGGEYIIVQNALTPESTVMTTVKNWLHHEMALFKKVALDPTIEK